MNKYNVLKPFKHQGRIIKDGVVELDDESALPLIEADCVRLLGQPEPAKPPRADMPVGRKSTGEKGGKKGGRADTESGAEA